MKDAGVELGLAPHVADLLVRQTVKGRRGAPVSVA